MENDEIKCQIQELHQKGHIITHLLPLQKPDCVRPEERWELAALH
jgi:hypothetical protein